MDTILWIVQIILAIKLITVTYTHGLRQGKDTLQAAIQRMGSSAKLVLYLAALGTLITTGGLLLPAALHWADWMTASAAGAAFAMLLVSLIFHIRYRDKPNIFVSLVLMAFTAFVFYGYSRP